LFYNNGNYQHTHALNHIEFSLSNSDHQTKAIMVSSFFSDANLIAGKFRHLA
jgi:hypothetical protein